MSEVLSERVALITGATGNLGQAVAARFAQAGARLVLVGRSADSLAKAYPNHEDWLLLPDIDLTSAQDTEHMAAETVRQRDRIDILVNTVGGYLGPATLENTDPDAWDRVMDLNARSAFLACRSVIPAMRAQGHGKIVNVAARTAQRGLASAALYSAAKSAVLRLTESLSDEVKADGINVNCVLPGTLDTPQNRRGRPGVDTSGWVQLEALADVILFLASDAARAVHGVGLPVFNLT